MNRDKAAFIKDISKELADENVAIFAGAGMSKPAGYVDWSELLKPIAEELGLDVDKENDLVTLAQFHCNENGNNRSQINKRLIEEFARDAEPTENHKILSRLPIKTFWTTNYDKLIEKSLNDAKKIVDVKYTTDHLVTTRPGRDAIVYKMHGDIEHPNSAILTRDDYEKYYRVMEPYITKLSGDLTSKTFIFLGFSFTDPNIDYILSRVRVAHDKNQKRHYCFIKKVCIREDEDQPDYDYRVRRQELFIGDLKRFNIKVITVNDYSEITELFRMIEYQYKRRTVFISGAAHTYGVIDKNEAIEFINDLSTGLIKKDFSIVSGFGLGVGSAVISGALEELYVNKKCIKQNQLILRPFPQQTTGSTPRDKLWHMYREDMISHAGVAIFIFGNKLENGEIVMSNGMREEYEIAKELGLFIIPVGATGWISKELWELENKELLKKNKNKHLIKMIANLDTDNPLSEILKTIYKILEIITK